VIFSFYVDDIIMLYYSDYQEGFDQLEQQLVKLYNLCQIGTSNGSWVSMLSVSLPAASYT
jgi:hypothetical protein